jgi:ABC-2 type transport system permease protein
MRALIALLRKEFTQIFRNRALIFIMFGMPIVQLLVLSHAASFELREVFMVVVDNDRSEESYRLVSSFGAGRFFKVVSFEDHADQALDYIYENKAQFVLVIPNHMARDLQSKKMVKVQFLVSGEDGVQAGLIQAYANGIIQKFSTQLLVESLPGVSPNIDIREHFAYNPELNYKFFMVPGILVLLVTLVGLLLSAMNVVREKEIGTIEQLNVTPIKRWQFLFGKLIPFWLIGLFELAIGLVLAKVFFQVPMIGDLSWIFLSAAIYLIVVLSIGLLISTVTQTQQQAMFIAWFFLVIFILMSGLFTPIQSMPDWAQLITKINPVSYFIEIMRRVLLKGAGWQSIQWQIFSLIIYAGIIMSVAVWRYQKVSR